MTLRVQIFSNLQSQPTFHSEERLVNFVRGREKFDGLPLLLVYACDPSSKLNYYWQDGLEVPSTPKKLLGSLLEGKSEAARLEEELMTSR